MMLITSPAEAVSNMTCASISYCFVMILCIARYTNTPVSTQINSTDNTAPITSANRHTMENVILNDNDNDNDNNNDNDNDNENDNENDNDNHNDNDNDNYNDNDNDNDNNTITITTMTMITITITIMIMIITLFKSQIKFTS